VSYTSPYSGLKIYEVWTGWLSFNGQLFTATNKYATKGQLNQWAFTYNVAGKPSFYPNSVNMGDGWWLVGFSTYTYGTTLKPDATYPGGAFWKLALDPPATPDNGQIEQVEADE